VHARAATRRAAHGVVGVIQLEGDHCSLNDATGPTALLDAGGRRLDLTSTGLPRVNPPMNYAVDDLLASGRLLWGFAVWGSWCGPAPASVLVSVSGNPAWAAGLKVPLTGAMPTCEGASRAVLQAGIPGYEADPVLPPPPDWAGLKVTARVDSTTPALAPLSGLAITISNPTTAPISLSPCPSYVLQISFATGALNGFSIDRSNGAVACTGRPKVLAPGGKVTYPITSPVPGVGAPEGLTAGTALHAEVAIAGVPTAKATSVVR
jgi:hypothetical protein